MKMKAIVCTKYGSPEVLQLTDVEKSTPMDDEVLVKVYATPSIGGREISKLQIPSLCLASHVNNSWFQRTKKKILGFQLDGEIESVGNDVRLFKEGD